MYDWTGQRLSKTDSGSPAILYSYMQGGTLIAENDNGHVTDYVYADGRPIADLQPGAATTADQVNYILADHLGTPQLAVNSSGTEVWKTTNQPFGTTGNVLASIIQNLRFPGQYADLETGFSYNLNRDYMPNLGRYLESDPIGLHGGLNTFAYTGNQPEAATDSVGLDYRIYGHPDGHESVAIDTPSGVVTFGFGPSNFGYSWLTGIIPLGPGQIDEGNQPYSTMSGASLVQSYPLSPADGQLLVDELRQMAKNPPIYYVGGFNCNTFANMVGVMSNPSATTTDVLKSASPIDIQRLENLVR